jgi:hypothetical protein
VAGLTREGVYKRAAGGNDGAVVPPAAWVRKDVKRAAK